MIVTVTQQDEDGKTLEQQRYDKLSEISDGYHTFGELYDYRMLLQAMLFNQWAQIYDSRTDSRLHDVHKSWKHSDGQPCFGGGWFVVVATLPSGQITNHYKAEHWDLFKIPARDMAAEYDGHTPQQAAERMREFLEASK